MVLELKAAAVFPLKSVVRQHFREREKACGQALGARELGSSRKQEEVKLGSLCAESKGENGTVRG